VSAPVFCCFLLLLCVNCRSHNSTEERKAGPPEGARLSLERTEYHLGQAVQFEEVAIQVPLENTGGRALSISSIEAGHNCRAAPPGTIEPGARIFVEVTCRPLTYGTFADRLRLKTNSTDSPAILMITADVTPALRLERDILDVTLSHGEKRTEVLGVVGKSAHDAKLRVPDQAILREHGLTLSISPAKSRDHSAYVEAHFEALRAGVFTGNLTLETGLTEPSEISIPYTFTVRGTLSVTPDTLYINVRDPTRSEVQVDIKSTAPAFSIKKLSVTEGLFAVRSERISAQHHRAYVRLLVDQVPEGVTGSVGRLSIQTTDATEPEKTLPIMAMGKVRHELSAAQ
jgi:hypothetical protein